VIGGLLAELIRTGEIQPHARFWKSGRHEEMRQFGKVDIPQEA